MQRLMWQQQRGCFMDWASVLIRYALCQCVLNAIAAVQAYRFRRTQGTSRSCLESSERVAGSTSPRRLRPQANWLLLRHAVKLSVATINQLNVQWEDKFWLREPRSLGLAHQTMQRQSV